jgi:hypothetical protein
MIGTKHALGNLQACRYAARHVIALSALLLCGCADLFYATVGGLGAAHGVAATPGLEFDPEHHLSLDVYAPRTADRRR